MPKDSVQSEGNNKLDPQQWARPPSVSFGREHTSTTTKIRSSEPVEVGSYATRPFIFNYLGVFTNVELKPTRSALHALEHCNTFTAVPKSELGTVELAELLPGVEEEIVFLSSRFPQFGITDCECNTGSSPFLVHLVNP